MNYFALLLVIALWVLGFTDRQKILAAREQAAIALQESELMKGELEAIRQEGRDAREKLEQKLEQKEKALGDSKEKNKELAGDLVAARKDLERIKSQSDADKTVVSEVPGLQQKLTEIEEELRKAKEEAEVAKTALAQSRVEVQRLQELQKRPPLGSTMDRKR